MGMPAAHTNFPIIDFSTPDRLSLVASIRQACIKFGCFYVVNHGVDKDTLNKLFNESRKLFSLPLEEKLALSKKEHRGYTSLYSERLDPARSKGDSKESFHIGSLDEKFCHLNQWPSEELLPHWRTTMETYHRKILNIGRSLLSLIALALNEEDKFFENVGALDSPLVFLRLIRYPGVIGDSNEDILGASAHSDYGMITLLVDDGVPGLQVCLDKDSQPCVWDDAHLVEGALIVNLGDTMERLTNCLFRSPLHRVIPTGQERYSAAFFFAPAKDFLVECLENCCNESNPPRFPPIRAGDYYRDRVVRTFDSSYDPYISRNM